MNHDAMYSIADNNDVKSLKNWRATCRFTDRTTAYTLNHRYDAALASFVRDPTGLRNTLRVTGSVISGSAALYILDVDRATKWYPNDLDIYAPITSAAIMVTYLVTVEGYEILDKPPPESRYYSSPGFNSVAHLRRGDFEIDVIRSNTISALHPIPYFWSTHLMNYLTADAYCIAYPNDTLIGRGLLNPVQLIAHQYPLPRTMRTMKKYKARGYIFRSRPTAWDANAQDECDSGPGCPRTVRYFGDNLCLMGSFGSHADAARGELTLPDPTRTVRWWRGGPTCGHKCMHSIFEDARSVPSVRTIRTLDIV